MAAQRILYTVANSNAMNEISVPVSRTLYSIYDNNRTDEILAQLEAEKKAAQAIESTAVNPFHKQAYLTTSEALRLVAGTFHDELPTSCCA